MSNQYFDAADALQRASKLLESFKLAHDALEAVGSVEQAAAEAKKAAEKAKAERDVAEAELKRAKDELGKAKTKAKELIEDAEAKAADLLANTDAALDAKRQEALLSATRVADDIFKKAREQEAAVLVNVKAQRAILADVTDKVNGLQAEVDSLIKTRDAVQKQLDSLKAKLG